ncbi:LuxR C-terminal-related transcriptional regulator [Salipaludibacillus daqingensis]|uniref:LuxR C-terminal-related transcriptional regulator n=1 Tax=Salipaludibacillus daqingensis TaxID=3041001 RepID=UPI0024769208|nr:LuxR C-terminal-related transcriptional regulator [Salipaludibacillus daqingensis]
MLKTNTRIDNTQQNSILFNDSKDLMPTSLIENVSNHIEMRKFQSGNNIKHWNFYVVDGYSEQTKQQLETHLHYDHCNTRTLLVISGPLDKNIIKYLLLPINGIVSLSFLNFEYETILNSLEKNAMFLEQGLHKNLSSELDFKKTFSKPIKQFILNKDKITLELSDRDYQVLQLLLDGHSNSEIAEKMHFARSTVSTIISSLLKKMQASDRTDATVKTIRNGWVDCYR